MAESVAFYLGFTAFASRLLRRKQHRSRQPDDGTGIIELHGPESPDVDICFVHGLWGDRINTWKWNDDNSKESTVWPRDFLPQDVQENHIKARILSYGYKSLAPTSEYLTQRTLYRHSQQLLSALAEVRKNHPDRPLIFVGHSVGGIVIKSALIFSSQAKQPEVLALSISTTGIVFLGTPHTEAMTSLDQSRWPKMLASIIELNKTDNSNLVKYLDRQSFSLQSRLQPFKALSDNILIVSYYEALQTPLIGMIVPKSTTRHPYGDKVDVILADHRNMCKFASRDNRDYRRVSSEIVNLCHEASRLALRNWERHRKSKGEEDASKEYMEIVQTGRRMSSNPGLDDFHVGVSLPPQPTKFVGRAKELGFLGDILIRRCPEQRTGPCATVNLYGLAGIGKTQIALKFAHANRDSFTSIFWIPATSRQSIEQGLVNIARTLPRRIHDPNSTAVPLVSPDSPSDAELDEDQRRSIVKTVTEWFQSPKNPRWLVIFDDLDSEGDPDIMKLIPDTTCHHGHCIITSRNPISWDVATKYSVGPFKPDESLSFLRTSTGLSDADEHDLADLSKLLEYLPLALSSAVSFISSTKSTLREYMRRHQSSLNAEKDREKTNTSLQNISPLSRNIFNVCCVLSMQSVCLSIFLTSSFRKNCPGDSMIAIRELSQNSLVALTEDERYLITHKTVRDFGRSILSSDQRRFASRVACESTLSVANSLREVRDGEEAFDTSFAECDVATVMSHCHPLIEAYLPSSYEWDIDLDMMGRTCERQGRNNDASNFYNLQINRKEETIPGLRKTKMRLAITRRISGDNVQAEALCEEIIQPQSDVTSESTSLASQTQLQGDEVDIGALRLLKKIAHEKSDSEEELAISKQIAATQEYRLGYKHLSTLEAVKELVKDLVEVGFYNEAEANMRRVLLTYENIPEANYVKKTEAFEILASIRLKQGKYDDATELFNRALRNHMARLGREHPTTQKCWSQLGRVYDMQGHYEIAGEVYDKCLEILDATLGANHADVLRVRGYKATNLANRNMHAEAENELRGVLDCMENYKNIHPENDRRRTALQLVDILKEDPRADDDAWLEEEVQNLGVQYDLDLHRRIGWLY